MGRSGLPSYTRNGAAWPDHGPARIRWAAVRYFLRYSKFLTVQSWIQHWSEHVDVLLLRIFGDSKELGVYAQMQQIVGVSFSLSVRSLDQVANAAWLFAAIARCIPQARRRTYAARLRNVLAVRRRRPQMAIGRIVGATALLSLFAFQLGRDSGRDSGGSVNGI